MSARQKKVTDRFILYRLDLSCECHPHYRIAPPSVGDTITCMRHGPAIVMGKGKVIQGDIDSASVPNGMANEPG